MRSPLLASPSLVHLIWMGGFFALRIAAGRPGDLDPILSELSLNEHTVTVQNLPAGLRVETELGIASFPWVRGSVIYRASDRERGLYETRATVTPRGDYLLMFPDGGHYGGKTTKVNRLLAMRSRDRGETWSEATEAFPTIDYNQHGFIPLVPRGGMRLMRSARSRCGINSRPQTGKAKMRRSALVFPMTTASIGQM